MSDSRSPRRDFSFTHDALRIQCEIVTTEDPNGDPASDARWHVAVGGEWRMMRPCTPKEIAGRLDVPAFQREVVAFVKSWVDH